MSDVSMIKALTELGHDPAQVMGTETIPDTEPPLLIVYKRLPGRTNIFTYVYGADVVGERLGFTLRTISRCEFRFNQG